MEIMSKNLVVTATETTQNANYKIECSGENGVIDRITVNIHKKNSDEEYIGNINLEHDSLSCSINSKDQNYISYFSDFSNIVDKLKIEMSKNDSGSSSGGNGDGDIVDDPTA